AFQFRISYFPFSFLSRSVAVTPLLMHGWILRSREPPRRQRDGDHHVIVFSLPRLELHPARAAHTAPEISDFRPESFALGEMLGKRDRIAVVMKSRVQCRDQFMFAYGETPPLRVRFEAARDNDLNRMKPRRPKHFDNARRRAASINHQFG